MISPLAQGFESTDTWLSIAIKIVKAHLKSYIISSSADQAAIVLYGTVRLAHVLWEMLTLLHRSEIDASNNGSLLATASCILQGQKSDESQFDHVYILQDMDEGSARRLRELDQLLGVVMCWRRRLRM